jgi:hypothetical protein
MEEPAHRGHCGRFVGPPIAVDNSDCLGWAATLRSRQSAPPVAAGRVLRVVTLVSDKCSVSVPTFEKVGFA